MYQAFLDEGRGLLGTEAAEVDATLGLSEESVDEEALAEAYAKEPLLQHQETEYGKFVQEDSESVMSNKTGMQVTFLSTNKSKNGTHIATSAAVRTLQSVWLFEVGEDTQRSLLGHPIVDWKRIDRIFIGSMSPDATLGLPGMLCTISASREKGHIAADIPVHVYGPPGLVHFVSTMLSISRTYLEMPVILHEFAPRAVPGDQLFKPVEVNRRSRLYAVSLPPDQLNPDGYYDGELSAMLSRHKKSKGHTSDLRAGTLPQSLPSPGDPMRTGISISEMTWTIRADSEWHVQAIPLKNSTPAVGFVVQESNRSGRLYPDVAIALGVKDRDRFTDLKEGRDVALKDGRVVRPEQCVGPVRPGRRFAVVPPCLDSSVFASVAQRADLVIHAASKPEGTGSSAIDLSMEAGRCARALNANELVLWEQSASLLDRQDDDEDKDYPVRMLDGAKKEFGREIITLGGCFRVYQWDREEGCKVPTEMPPELAHLLPDD